MRSYQQVSHFRWFYVAVQGVIQLIHLMGKNSEHYCLLIYRCLILLLFLYILEIRNLIVIMLIIVYFSPN